MQQYSCLESAIKMKDLKRTTHSKHLTVLNMSLQRALCMIVTLDCKCCARYIPCARPLQRSYHSPRLLSGWSVRWGTLFEESRSGDGFRCPAAKYRVVITNASLLIRTRATLLPLTLAVDWPGCVLGDSFAVVSAPSQSKLTTRPSHWRTCSEKICRLRETMAVSVGPNR